MYIENDPVSRPAGDIVSKSTLLPTNTINIEEPERYILENDSVKVEFDAQNASIISLVDKKTGKDLVSADKPSGIFRLIDEDDHKGMTAWRIGRYMNIEKLDKNIKIYEVHADGSLLRQWIKFRTTFGNSWLDVAVSLNQKSERLEYQVECDWQEMARKGISIPQLNFYVPVNYRCRSYRYDIPFGTITREEMEMDVPA